METKKWVALGIAIVVVLIELALGNALIGAVLGATFGLLKLALVGALIAVLIIPSIWLRKKYKWNLVAVIIIDTVIILALGGLIVGTVLTALWALLKLVIIVALMIAVIGAGIWLYKKLYPKP